MLEGNITDYRCPECDSRLKYLGLRCNFSLIALPLHVYVCTSRNDGDRECPVVIGSHQENPIYGYYFLNQKLPSQEICEILGEQCIEQGRIIISTERITEIRLATDYIEEFWPDSDYGFVESGEFVDEHGNTIAWLDRTCGWFIYQGHTVIGPKEAIAAMKENCKEIDMLFPESRFHGIDGINRLLPPTQEELDREFADRPPALLDHHRKRD